MNKFGERTRTALVAIATVLVVAWIGALFYAYPVKWLINWIFPQQLILVLFGTTSISVFKAWGINFLFGILFRCSSSSSSKTDKTKK